LKNRYLILFTNKFPYEGGEVFLETEIQMLAMEFQKVYIVPLHFGDKFSCELPLNTEIIRPSETNGKFSKIFLLKLLFQYFFKELVFSRHRFKYLFNLGWCYNYLAGLVKDVNCLVISLKDLLTQKDVVFYSYWFNEHVSRAIVLKLMGYRFRLITRVHLYDFEEEFNGRGYLPFRYTEWRNVDCVVPISSYAHNYLIRQFGKDRRLKDVNRLGVAPTKALNQGGTGSQFTIVSCSVLSWYKRPQLLVEIISKLEVPVKWVHFGGGALETEFLEAVNKLPAHTEFEYRGQVPNAHVLQFYKENGVDLFINVSEYEGIPYSMMEAIAAGIPLVGCDVCGVPEIVTEQTGLLLPKEVDPETAAIKIAQFLIEKARDRDFRLGIQQFQQHYFNAEGNYKKFIEANLINS